MIGGGGSTGTDSGTGCGFGCVSDGGGNGCKGWVVAIGSSPPPVVGGRGGGGGEGGWGVPEWPWGAMKGLVSGGSPRTWCLPARDGRWTAARMMQRVRMTRMIREERTRIWLARTKRRDLWKAL